MKFVLSFNGSRGDVQPAVALGVRLSERGHEVVLAVPPNLVGFAAKSGIPTQPCGLSTKELLDSELVSRDLKSGNPAKKLQAIGAITMRGGKQSQTELMDLTADADAIVAGSAGQERALNVASARRIPYVPLHYCPVRRNRSVPVIGLPGGSLPGWANKASWALAEQLLWLGTMRSENALRADLNLPPVSSPAAARIRAQGLPEIQAYDPALFHGLSSEWAQRLPLTGFLNLAPATRRSVDGSARNDEVIDWIDAGPPPIYAGFGSMPIADPAALAKALVDVTGALGYRLLVAAGWSEFMAGRTDDRVRVVGTVDHDVVLPRCAAAIHHGGAGSTAAGIRAGIPTLVCWVGADQPMWGRQLERAGVGRSVALAKLKASTLQAALRSVLAPEYASAATRLARDIIPPDEAADAASTVIEGAVRSWHSRLHNH